MSERRPKKTDLMSEDARTACPQKVGTGFWIRTGAKKVLRAEGAKR